MLQASVCGYLGADAEVKLRLNPNHLPHLRPTNRTSGVGDSHGLTGGVYKTRERIHRNMLICDY